jgi:DNA-binding NtrC family response regulator
MYALDYGRPMKNVAASALDAMKAYHWPGNVRELQNCVEQALALNSGPEVRPEDLLLGRENQSGPAPSRAVTLTFDSYEKLALERALAECENDVESAAQKLEVGLSTLYRKMKKHSIPVPRVSRSKTRTAGGTPSPKPAPETGAG